MLTVGCLSCSPCPRWLMRRPCELRLWLLLLTSRRLPPAAASQVDNLKQQSTYFMSRQSGQLAEARQQLEAVKAAAASEQSALQVSLGGLAGTMRTRAQAHMPVAYM